MRTLISFAILSLVKVFSTLFYRLEFEWLTKDPNPWKDIRLVALLNHTSLFEPLYVRAAPFSFLSLLSRKMVAPGADKTLKRPIVGLFYKFLSPGMVSISRKRDKTWKSFMSSIEKDSIILIAPEGRMKRPNGLDLSGKPMTVKAGIADILSNIEDGKMLIGYSGGLHHIQVPGQMRFRLFKTLKMNAEVVDIKDYKNSFKSEGIQWKRDVVADMQHRLETNCPQL